MNPSTALTRPAHPLEAIRALVLDSVTSPHSRRAYGKALDDFFSWFQSESRGGFSRSVVHAYRAELERRELAPSTINVRLAAIRKLASEAADNGLLSPETAAAILRVKGTRHHGVRMGNWLTKDQTERLLHAPDGSTLRGKRDRAILALLIGCGLRRNEAALLTFDQIQQREGRWAIVDLIGKHGRIRTVPMPGWAKAAIDDWAAAGNLSTGRVLRAIRRGACLEDMTPQSIFLTVGGYGERIGVKIAPHDLRRTFAKLAHKGRAALEQIQMSLGHASILTTERYLGARQDFSDAPCDRLGLELNGNTGL